MVNHTNGNDLRPVQAVRDYLHAVFSCMKDAIFNSFLKLQQPSPSFPRKLFSIAVALILGFLQVTSQGKGLAAAPIFDSNPTLYYTAVTAFLIYCLACGFEIVSSSHPVRPISGATSNLLQRCMFLAGSLSFTATASFLFPDSIRAVMFALIFAVISTIYLLYCAYPFEAINTQSDDIV